MTLLFFAQEDRADAKFMNIASVEETVRFAKEDVLEHIDSFIEYEETKGKENRFPRPTVLPPRRNSDLDAF